MNKFFNFFCSILLLCFISGVTHAVPVTVTVTNNSPSLGIGLAPVWVGFHNGSFDSHNIGESASSALETLAEVGSPAPLSDIFSANGTLAASSITQVGTRVQGNTGLLVQGDTQNLTFNVDADGSNNYFSYASMVLPSSDYFIANDNPLSIDLSSILSTGGVFEFNIGLPNSIKDAGTEINDFAFSAGNPLVGIPDGNAAAGTTENGNITNVANPFSNFLNTPNGFDLGNLNFNNSTLYPNGIATIKITVNAVPEPRILFVFALGLVTMALLRRRKIQTT